MRFLEKKGCNNHGRLYIRAIASRAEPSAYALSAPERDSKDIALPVDALGVGSGDGVRKGVGIDVAPRKQ